MQPLHRSILRVKNQAVNRQQGGANRNIELLRYLGIRLSGRDCLLRPAKLDA